VVEDFEQSTAHAPPITFSISAGDRTDVAALFVIRTTGPN